MADRLEHLRHMVELVEALVQDGFSREEMAEIYVAAVAHVDGDPRVPYARGTCSNCGAVQVAWSEYQWAQLVRAPCRKCGKPW